jgi:hypothetical protein
MNSSRGEIVEALSGMSRAELAEAVCEALRAFNSKEFRLCLAEVHVPASDAPTEVELVALPVVGYERQGIDDLHEQGKCENCGTQVVSAAKRASCPVCFGEIRCT